MTKLPKVEAHPSPYYVFCREQRPLLPAHLTNRDREKLLGQNWRKLSEAGRATYQRGLTRLPCSGQGGLRRWALSQPAAVSVSAAAEAQAETATETAAETANETAIETATETAAETATEAAAAHPEDQPAAKRRAYQDDQGRFQREAYRRFCKEQQPLLPAGTTNTDREKLLGQLAPRPEP